VREHLPDEAEELLQGRVQVINLWRPIRGPLRDSPLAVCDVTTVAADDLVASDLIYPKRNDLFGEIQSGTPLVLFPGNDDGRSLAIEML
jgi:hypothetical protein